MVFFFLIHRDVFYHCLLKAFKTSSYSLFYNLFNKRYNVFSVYNYRHWDYLSMFFVYWIYSAIAQGHISEKGRIYRLRKQLFAKYS
jgi:hypothetical protein